MNFQEILQPAIQEYINNNIARSISSLALQKNPFPTVDFKIILNQIEAKSKSKDKLPTWFNSENIIYPSKISVEQTSSEITAKYKASLIRGNSIIDLTGGFGVDDYYFAQQFQSLTHCEINPELSAIVLHNFKALNATNINCICGDSYDVLKQLNQKFDCIYIDPSRRSDAKGKVFLLKDCLPNVVELQDFYHQFSDVILIKTSPILDISAGISELHFIKKIHIVAVENEVKELIWEIHKNHKEAIEIKTINISKNKTESFDFKILSEVTSSYSLQKKYLFEPNSAVMKSGGFNEIASLLNLEKLHQHSHLYTSDNVIDFPGRTFQINKVIPYSKQEMKQHLENSQANVTTRNFPETVENIRKKWKIKDGGTTYCFFSTNMNNEKIVLICTKINH